jgi:hypothetical protein
VDVSSSGRGQADAIDDDRALHARLLTGDPTAPSDLALAHPWDGRSLPPSAAPMTSPSSCWRPATRCVLSWGRDVADTGGDPAARHLRVPPEPARIYACQLVPTPPEGSLFRLLFCIP